MKKFIAFLLAGCTFVTMMLGGFTALADEKEGGNTKELEAVIVDVKSKSGNTKELEAVIVDVKSKIDISEEYSEFTFESQVENGRIAYNLEWETKTEPTKRISVTQKDGVITHYNVQNNDDFYTRNEGVTLSKLSNDQLISRVMEQMDTMNPKLKDQLTYEISSYRNLSSTTASISIERLIDGVNFPLNSGNVQVDKNTGEINYMYLTWWSNVTISNDGEALNDEQWKAKFAENVGMKPIYELDEKKNPQIVYTPKSDTTIDAVTGERFVPDDESENIYGDAGGMGGGRLESMKNDASATPTPEPLSPSELDSITINNNLLTVEKAEEIARKDKYLGLNSDWKLSHSNLVLLDKEYRWQLNFYAKDRYAYVTVDAQDGNVLGFNKDAKITPLASSTQKNAETIDKENAKVANEVMAYYLKDKAKEYKITENDTKITPRNGEPKSVMYTRFVNDIEFPMDNAIIYFNENGEIVGFRYNYSKINFPKIKIIDEKTAVEKLTSQKGMSMAFVPRNYEKQIISLVYKYDYPTEIDAVTGELKDIITEQNVYLYNDLDEHWCKDIATKMAENGIGFAGGEMLPDQAITNGEYLKLLADIFDIYESTDEALAKTLAKRKIIDEENIDLTAKLTKLDAVKYLINASGGGSYAMLKGIFVKPFDDVTEDAGYVSIAKGMGIVKGEDGKFNPGNSITRGESMSILYNYLTK